MDYLHMHFLVQMELDKLQPCSIYASTAPLTLRGPTTTREWSRWFVMSSCWPSLTTLKGMVRWSPQQTEEEIDRPTWEFPVTHILMRQIIPYA